MPAAPSRIVCSLRRVMLAGVAALVTAGASVFPAGAVVLADFNGTGFDSLFDDFNQQVGPTSVRLTDTINGWGGGVLEYQPNQNFTPYLDEFFEVEYTVHNGHGTDIFTLELYDSDNGDRSVKYDIPTTGGSVGQPRTYTVPVPIGQPTYGNSDWQNFNFGNVDRLQVLGQWQDAGPFDVTIDEIRITGDAPPAYGGAAPDAAWRTEAATRIDQNRKADLSVVLTRGDGTPIQNADVRVMQQEHAFKFGTAVAVNSILGNDGNSQQYRQKLLDLGFNTATLENGLKWQALEGEFGPSFTLQRALDTIDWLNNNGLDVRGHVLVWPGVNNLPNSIDTLIQQTNNNVPGARDQLEQAVLDHIDEVAGATAGKLIDWDVINEIGTNNDLLNIFGDAVMDDWFARARAADPTTQNFINEFNIISDQQRSKRQSYLNQILGLVGRGAEIDGVGMQGHFSASSLTDLEAGNDPQTVWDVLDQFHDATGLPISITEYDLNTTDEQLKADYLRDFLTAVFAHEAVTEFIMWGFWEGRHWRPDAAMINQDFSETEMAAVWRQLVMEEWWTDEEAATAADGTLDLRVFQGDYVIEVDVDGETLTYNVTIGPEGYTLEEMIAAALAGDYNGNGQVEQGDLDFVLQNWGLDTTGNVPGGWINDLPDGLVDQAELDKVLANWGSSATPDFRNASVPEPAAAVMLLGASAMATRRR